MRRRRSRRHAHLGQRHTAHRLSIRLQHQLPALAAQGDRPPPDAPEDVHRLPRRAVDRRRQLVGLHLSLERLAQRVLGTEETVRRHQPSDPLMRAEVVVESDPVAESALRLRQAVGPHPLPKLRPDRLPQSLALAHRLRVVRRRQHLTDAEAVQPLAEGRPPAPAVVLRALVGEDLLRLAESLDAFFEGFEHELLPLVRQQPPAHDVAAVVVQEDRQRDTAPGARQHETRDVALPELTRTGPLETPRQMALLARTGWRRVVA